MKQEQIEELKKLSGAATPQPWHYDYEPRANMSMIAGRDFVVCGIPNELEQVDRDAQHSNANIIVAAVAALPTLVREREQLLGALRAIRSSGCWSSASDEDCPVCTKADAAIAAAES